MSTVHVIGAAGFTGAQLAALVDAHPHFSLGQVTARADAGRRILDVAPEYRVDAMPAYLRLDGPNQWLPEEDLPGFRATVTGFLARVGALADELMEVLTLIQTKTGRRIPVILMGTEFWKGLIDWMRDSLLGNGLIDARDLELMKIVDEPAQVVEAIFDFYQARGFGPTARERENLLYL